MENNEFLYTKIMTKIKSSEYIEQARYDYALYVLQHRALPYAVDGLKPSGRRVLWMARNGEKIKTVNLAGATMVLHPHSMPDDAINTLAAPYGNNFPLFQGIGAFGTRLKPTAYAASRYTNVKVSDFTKDVVFKDIEIVPMVENYDGTLMEPKHFLPLVPIVLLNPTEGIAIGFSCNILPRSLKHIITAQLTVLKGKKLKGEILPEFAPFNSVATQGVVEEGKNPKWLFEGKFKRVSHNTVKITNLPYGNSHESFINNLIKLADVGFIDDYDDDSKKTIDVTVKFPRGVLAELDDQELMKKLNLTSSQSEIMNVISFNGESVLSTDFNSLVKDFTLWRLEWYKTRYERLLQLTEEEIQRYQDILLAIKKNVGGAAKSVRSRTELKEFLQEIGIVNLDYIADLPVYRFTEEERKKTTEKLEEAYERLKQHKDMLSNDDERKKVYVSELTQILKKYGGVGNE